MLKTKMKKALMIIAIVAIVAIAGSMIYYFVFFRTEKERAEIKIQEEKLEFEKEKQASGEIKEVNKKVALFEALADLEKWHNDSLNQAYKDYSAQWKKACEDLGGKFISPSESWLPKAIAETLNENYNQAIKRIDEQYQAEIEKTFKLFE